MKILSTMRSMFRHNAKKLVASHERVTKNVNENPSFTNLSGTTHERVDDLAVPQMVKTHPTLNEEQLTEPKNKTTQAIDDLASARKLQQAIRSNRPFSINGGNGWGRWWE